LNQRFGLINLKFEKLSESLKLYETEIEKA